MKTRPTVISIVGARPQFIKLAPLAPVLAGRFNHLILHTGQHYDREMSEVFFKQLHIPKANRNLNIGGGGHGAMTGAMLAAIEKYLLQTRPDFVLIYGDTNSTLAGAVAAAKLSVPVGHVEAGMRSFVKDMPEEINRRLSDHASDLLFCPTAAAVKNLKAEGIKKNLIRSGDLMFELLHRRRATIKKNNRPLKKHGLQPGQYLFMTVHRAANVDCRDNLEKLLAIIEQAPLPILLPLHPRTRARLGRFRLLKRLERCDRVVLERPMSYLDTLTAAACAQAVLTDSGGLQKEALFLGTPVLTLRDETEWVETLHQGNRLVGLDPDKILRSLRRLPKVPRISYRINGKAPSTIITSSIDRYLSGK
ncbi:MAG TPA: UDP-N-acetylglucosamine 2-epimerase (non-hydrolyzing) [candidate division Zixibacteria bacterium]|nr:UDP-N-acetylglucosamine 2-epimerase (non-hydrolyzing) [candidate division Zixibacteria bacterium]